MVSINVKSPVTHDDIKNEIAMLLIKELHDYAINQYPLEYPKKLHPRLKQIGELLDSLGEGSLMCCACAVLPQSHQSDLDILWDGIGTWIS